MITIENKIEESLSMETATRLRQIKHIALDMDGTIYNGSTLFPFTITFLNKMKELGIGYSFLTNNPSRSTADYLHHLKEMGIEATADEFYTSAQATIDYIHTHHPECKRLFLLGTPSMIREFEEAGFISTSDDAEDEPDAVVASFDMSLAYPRLCRAAWWVSQKKLYIATNPDRVCPTDKPVVLVDCGSICSALEYATGRKPDVIVGKPDPRMLHGIMERHGLRAEQIAMVGDRIYTDILMAQNAQALGVLVLSGETTYDTAMSVQPGPDLILRDLAELQELIIFAQNIS
ncbi:HAD-IIA family hydrolase [Bacteroides sp.]|uniref:HAD-IIA family hydrolase n=1 Tax=Bacteroides sp. TaxID=29523 RepID=UPI002634E453|nr:HAD-IIA family hydrolase [Bacteroides sp.]MDD3038498.1 HAD-IIA family hydrolase [Bacteroides sp.]